MQRADIPAKFSIPFAESAGGSFRRTVPVPSQIGIQDGAASFTTGFPPDNFSPLAAGGVPPFGQDVNGILFQISAWDRWFFSGGPVAYDGAYSAEIGGYPESAIVASATVLGRFYLCLVDDNVTNPDAGGANWKAFAFNTSVNGQCYFQYATATTAKLMPQDGAAIVIAGVPYEIPAAGITLDLTSCFVNGAVQAVAANTGYNAYLFNNAGTLTVDLWTGATSGHVASTTAGNVGVEVRNNAGTNDNSRSLIGKITLNASSQLIAQGTSVISWFNQRKITLLGATSSGSLTSTGPSSVEVNASGRVPFLTWSLEPVFISAYVNLNSNAPESGASVTILTPTGQSGGFYSANGAANTDWSGMLFLSVILAEGLQYGTVEGQCSDGGTTVLVTAFQVSATVNG